MDCREFALQILAMTNPKIPTLCLNNLIPRLFIGEPPVCKYLGDPMNNLKNKLIALSNNSSLSLAK